MSRCHQTCRLFEASEEKKMLGDVFSCCYTPLIHGVFLGQGPLVCSQSSWPQQKTPYCLHSLSDGVFIWEPEELGGAGGGLDGLGTHPHYPAAAAAAARLGKKKNGPLLHKKNRRKEEEKNPTVPSFYNSTAKLLELGSELEGGGEAGKQENLILKDIQGFRGRFIFLVLVYILISFWFFTVLLGTWLQLEV